MNFFGCNFSFTFLKKLTQFLYIYPKMISECNLLDPQTGSLFKLHSPHKSKKELKKQIQDALSQTSDDSNDDQGIQVSQNPNYFQDSQDPYEY
jgi:hypothetical protein